MITAKGTPVKKKKAKEQPKHRFQISVRDRSHFVAIISVLDKNCGKGVRNWTMTKKVGKFLRMGRVPAQTELLIFNKTVDPVELETLIKLL
tara:strand:+ start:177 stop:449 length:273 start_codon:yes stop_codon:yes gene_type:complete